MNIRPILFSLPMVRALLDGKKTQTRRIVKSDWEDKDDDNWPLCYDHYGRWNGGWYRQQCPYGQVGELLWARETWSKAKLGSSHELFYRADGECSGRQLSLSYVEREPKWRPSIFMPRWASRITLQVTNVRIERLQDISEADAIAEGACVSTLDARADYRQIWQEINGIESWDANPWVWVIEFEVIKRNVDEILKAS